MEVHFPYLLVAAWQLPQVRVKQEQKEKKLSEKMSNMFYRSTYFVRLTICVCILATPSGNSNGLIQSVAPRRIAISNLALFMSTAKILLAFLVFAA